jgi:predicted dehydrogenase
MVEACREGNVIFITTLPLRFNPQIKKLKERVKNDGLGRIDAVMATNHGCMYKPKTPDWVKNPKQNGGGCIIDHTIHVADIIRWVTGQEFETVKTEAQTSFHDIEAEDVAVLTGKLSSDAIYQIDCSWSRLERDPAWGDVTFRVVGSKGAASLDVYNNRRIEVYKEKTIEFRYLDYIREDHRQIFINYLHHKEKGAPLIAADGFDGLKTMELAAAAYDSLKIRDFVKVPENFCPDKNLSKCKN